MRTNTGIDPNQEEWERISFMHPLRLGHQEAATAMMEMKMVASAKGRGGFARRNVDERLGRAARQLRAAADHLEKARGRQP